MPRNVDSAASDLYNFYLYNIDDLTQIVQQTRSAREIEVPRAELIVEEHVGKFLTWQASVELIGVVEALRHKLKAERAEFVRDRAERVPGLTSEQREQVDRVRDRDTIFLEVDFAHHPSVAGSSRRTWCSSHCTRTVWPIQPGGGAWYAPTTSTKPSRWTTRSPNA